MRSVRSKCYQTSSQFQIMAKEFQKMAKSWGTLQSHWTLQSKSLPKAVDLELSFSDQPIEGWRLWRVAEFGRRGGVTEHRLFPVGGGNEPWEPLILNRAACRRFPHEAPWSSCGCGFWGFRTMEMAKSAITDYNVHALGIVHLGGRVLECTNGWRGQLAYPQGLVFFNIEKKIAKEVATVYGIPYEMAGFKFEPGKIVEITRHTERYSVAGFNPSGFQQEPSGFNRIEARYSCGHVMNFWSNQFTDEYKTCQVCLDNQHLVGKKP